jgi:hypothetical protein
LRVEVASLRRQISANALSRGRAIAAAGRRGQGDRRLSFRLDRCGCTLGLASRLGSHVNQLSIHGDDLSAAQAWYLELPLEGTRLQVLLAASRTAKAEHGSFPSLKW